MAVETSAPSAANAKVDEWTTMRGLTRQRTTSSGGDSTKVQEWASMRNLGNFMRRKSALALGRSNNQISWSSSNGTSSTNSMNSSNLLESEKRVRDLELELTELKRDAEERISDLELKVGNRDVVLRRRALVMKEKDNVIELLEAKVAEMANHNKVLSMKLADKEVLLKVCEDEKKVRPAKGLVRTIALAGTVAMVALASGGGERR